MDKKIPKQKKGFNKLPEAVQEKISPKLAAEFNMGGMVDKRSPFMGGGIAYTGGGKAMKKHGKLGKGPEELSEFPEHRKKLRKKP